MKTLKNKIISTKIMGIFILCTAVACDSCKPKPQDEKKPTPITDEKKLTPITDAMIKAAKDGNYFFLADLLHSLQKGQAVDINAKNMSDSNQRTALHYAAKLGNSDIAKVLLEQGADVQVKETKHGATPLHWAVLQGNLDVVIRLLNAPGTDVNVVDIYGATPLYIAAYQGRVDVVNVLLAAPGIEINKPAKEEISTTGLLRNKAEIRLYTPLGIAKKRKKDASSLAKKEIYQAVIDALKNRKAK